MIKVETVGMLDIAKINPVLTSATDVTNDSIITVDGVTYLVSNTITGDDSYKKDVVIPAGEFLNGYDVEAWKGQKLVIDGKHITDEISGLAKGAILVVGSDGKLTKNEAAPASGVYFIITDTGVTLTELAIKAKIAVASSSGSDVDSNEDSE